MSGPLSVVDETLDAVTKILRARGIDDAARRQDPGVVGEFPLVEVFVEETVGCERRRAVYLGGAHK